MVLGQDAPTTDIMHGSRFTLNPTIDENAPNLRGRAQCGLPVTMRSGLRVLSSALVFGADASFLTPLRHRLSSTKLEAAANVPWEQNISKSGHRECR